MNLNYSAILPEMVMAGGAIVVLMVDALRRIENHRGDAANRGSGLLLTLSLLVAAGAAVAAFAVRGESGLMFQDSARSDALSFGIRLIVLATTILVLLVGSRYVSTFTRYPGEYYSLLLLSATGMMAMGIASDLMVLFIALETFSLSLILLAGMYRHNRSSTEASLKYFLLGAFASGFFVYGSALIYGVTGTVSFAGMGPALQAAADGGPGAVLLWAGIALLLVGFGFKLSLVPFHMWTPDVYQGAPTSVTAFMSVGTKTAMCGALVRIFLMTFPYGFENWTGPLIVLAVLTMTVGNVTALCQTSIKRMLGYSGIAHAGYVLAGLVPGTETAVNSALFYLFAYAFMNIGAFIIVMAIEHSVEDGRGTKPVARHRSRHAGPWPGFMAFVPVQPERHSAPGRFLRQVPDFPLHPGRRPGLAGCGRGRQQRDQRLLLPAHRGHDVLPAAAAGSPCAPKFAGHAGGHGAGRGHGPGHRGLSGLLHGPVDGTRPVR